MSVSPVFLLETYVNVIIICNSPEVWRLYFDGFGEVKRSPRWYRDVLDLVHQDIVSIYGKDFVNYDVDVILDDHKGYWLNGKYSSKKRDMLGYSGGGKYVVCSSSCPRCVSMLAVNVDMSMRALIDEASREKNEAES